MKKVIYVILIIGVIFGGLLTIQLINTNKNATGTSYDIEVISEYSNGKVTTIIKADNPQKISSTEFQYRTFFLDQYVNLAPRLEIFSFPKYEETHTYKIYDYLLQGKKDDFEVEVVINYDDDTQEIIRKVTISDIKRKAYDNFVIAPEFIEDSVYYHVDGLTVEISKDSYNGEIIFYSNGPTSNSAISVGFHKDYALYPLITYGVMSEAEALERNYEGISRVDYTTDVGANETNIVVEFGSSELNWDGFYPYDIDDNEVLYEGSIGDEVINLFRDNTMEEVSKASHEKYRQMKTMLPNMKFIITR